MGCGYRHLVRRLGTKFTRAWGHSLLNNSFHAFPLLPTEIRLQIWSLAYFSEPPRLVALRTKPHDENHSEENTFCPRYSPSPAPAVVNICHEARAEARRQARTAGHIVRLHVRCQGSLRTECIEEFYFRFEIDISYLPPDSHLAHFDDSAEVGILPHFRRAVDYDATVLQNMAITRVEIAPTRRQEFVAYSTRVSNLVLGYWCSGRNTGDW
jgi:hypothetical protein